MSLPCFGACEQQAPNVQWNKRVQRDSVEAQINPELPSAHYFLSLNDIKKFRKGRSKIDILKDIKWKGNFQMAGLHKQGSACAIAYDLF